MLGGGSTINGMLYVRGDRYNIISLRTGFRFDKVLMNMLKIHLNLHKNSIDLHIRSKGSSSFLQILHYRVRLKILTQYYYLCISLKGRLRCLGESW